MRKRADQTKRHEAPLHIILGLGSRFKKPSLARVINNPKHIEKYQTRTDA